VGAPASAVPSLPAAGYSPGESGQAWSEGDQRSVAISAPSATGILTATWTLMPGIPSSSLEVSKGQSLVPYRAAVGSGRSPCECRIAISFACDPHQRGLDLLSCCLTAHSLGEVSIVFHLRRQYSCICGHARRYQKQGICVGLSNRKRERESDHGGVVE
jgi:hypothetical protein